MKEEFQKVRHRFYARIRNALFSGAHREDISIAVAVAVFPITALPLLRQKTRRRTSCFLICTTSSSSNADALSHFLENKVCAASIMIPQARKSFSSSIAFAKSDFVSSCLRTPLSPRSQVRRYPEGRTLRPADPE